MTRKLTEEQLQRLGLTPIQIDDLGLSDEWIDEELRRMEQPSPLALMSDEERATWVREEARKRFSRSTGIERGWRLVGPEPIAWAAERVEALDPDSDERAHLVALLEGVAAGADFMMELAATQEDVGAYLREEITRPQLLARVRQRGRKRGAPRKTSKDSQIFKAWRANTTVDQIARALLVTPKHVRETIREEAKRLGHERPIFPRKSRK